MLTAVHILQSFPAKNVKVIIAEPTDKERESMNSVAEPTDEEREVYNLTRSNRILCTMAEIVEIHCAAR